MGEWVHQNTTCLGDILPKKTLGTLSRIDYALSVSCLLSVPPRPPFLPRSQCAGQRPFRFLGGSSMRSSIAFFTAAVELFWIR